jgi:hypothetical protein
MIDIRYNLFFARKKGVIGKKAKTALARTAKEIYFPHRNYPGVAEEAKRKYPALAGEIDSFASYVEANRKSLKEIDAIRLVQFLKERYESTTR